eukprot:c20710_g1_i11.p1 GENE.c20710_g1_i11~~c20710_g1_i11.p1  ORF type:complete len:430 (+),score=104.57 c20710_g1_i11:993-2282(+)
MSHAISQPNHRLPTGALSNNLVQALHVPDSSWRVFECSFATPCKPVAGCGVDNNVFVILASDSNSGIGRTFLNLNVATEQWGAPIHIDHKPSQFGSAMCPIKIPESTLSSLSTGRTNAPAKQQQTPQLMESSRTISNIPQIITPDASSRPSPYDGAPDTSRLTIPIDDLVSEASDWETESDFGDIILTPYELPPPRQIPGNEHLNNIELVAEPIMVEGVSVIAKDVRCELGSGVRKVKVQWYRCNTDEIPTTTNPESQSIFKRLNKFRKDKSSNPGEQATGEKIAGANFSTYVPNADDFGFELQIQLTPVLIDGSSGKQIVIRENVPLNESMTVEAEAMASGRKKAKFLVKIMADNTDAKLVMKKTGLKIRTGPIGFKEHAYTADMMRLDVKHPLLIDLNLAGKGTTIMCTSPQHRDLIRLVFRIFAKI